MSKLSGVSRCTTSYIDVVRQERTTSQHTVTVSDHGRSTYDIATIRSSGIPWPHNKNGPQGPSCSCEKRMILNCHSQF